MPMIVGVLVGIALFLTLFVMSPTISAIKKDAWDPANEGQIKLSTAISRGEEPLRNVPRAARDEGHIILGIVPDGNDHIVTIRHR